MSRRATLLALALLPAAFAAAPVASAKKKPTSSIRNSKYLWATVNACDTAAHPDTVGIRASMAGSGIPSEEMFVRFQLQYYSEVDKHWHNLGTEGDSGFIDIGSARYRARATGRFFTVVPSGASSLLRGAVTFEWRHDSEVVRRQRKRTEAGHRHTANADPVNYTASQCKVVK